MSLALLNGVDQVLSEKSKGVLRIKINNIIYTTFYMAMMHLEKILMH